MYSARTKTKLISLTLVLWMFGCGTHAYLFIRQGQLDPTNYGYEKFGVILLSAFLVYRFPYWLTALVVALGLELFIPEIWPQREAP